MAITSHTKKETQGNEKSNKDYQDLERSRELRQMVNLTKSIILLEFVGYNFELCKTLLYENRLKSETTTIVIELNLLFTNSKLHSYHHDEISKVITIPTFIMRYLFEKSFLKNTNKYNDMCLNIARSIDSAQPLNICSKQREELVLAKKILNLLANDHVAFTINFGFDDIVEFYNQILNVGKVANVPNIIDPNMINTSVA